MSIGRKDSGKDQGNDNEDDVIRVSRTPTNPALFIELEHARQYNRARGLGAGRTGSAVFHLQRLTALALIPLTIWFAASVVWMSTGTRTEAAAWLGGPVNAALMGVFIVIALRHAVIGIRIVFEDYMRDVRLRGVCMLGIQAIALVLGVATVVALTYLVLQ